ncbi:MAG: hypothetical protein WD490_00840 [Opitutales bacterium]
MPKIRSSFFGCRSEPPNRHQASEFEMGRGCLAWSIGFANLAVLLRIIPSLMPMPNWTGIFFSGAGIAGLAAIVLFASTLILSWRPASKEKC